MNPNYNLGWDVPIWSCPPPPPHSKLGPHLHVEAWTVNHVKTENPARLLTAPISQWFWHEYPYVSHYQKLQKWPQSLNYETNADPLRSCQAPVWTWVWAMSTTSFSIWIGQPLPKNIEIKNGFSHKTGGGGDRGSASISDSLLSWAKFLVRPKVVPANSQGRETVENRTTIFNLMANVKSSLLPLATKLRQGNVFTPVCHSFCLGVCVWWGERAWQGACEAGGKVMFLHLSVILFMGEGCMAEACMEGHVWQGFMHGRGHVWQGGCAWWGACVAGGAR